MTNAQVHVVLQVGVGAFVVNSKKEVLVVQERFGPLKGSVRNSSLWQTQTSTSSMPFHYAGCKATPFIVSRRHM